MNQGVSVIVCCYNSALRLPKTLEALAKQNTQTAWEVIVVDNNSSDDTSEVAIKLWQALGNPTELKVIKEPKAGLSNARMRGAKEAAFEYLIFCDDDNWLFEDYVEIANNYLSTNLHVGVVGGIGIAECQITPPEWFKKYSDFYAVGKKGDDILQESIYGAGMVLRKAIYLKLFEKVPPLISDRSGKTLLSGGDDEICFRFKFLGYEVHQIDALRFFHFISEDRLVLKHLENLSFWIGYSRMYLMPYFHKKKNNKTNNRRVLWVKDLFYLIKKRLRTTDPISKKNFSGSIKAIWELKSSYLNRIELLLALDKR